MADITLQVPSIILPQAWTIGIETENLNNLVVHYSIEFPVRYLQEKTIQVYAVEIIVFGAAGNLQLWVEVSPYPSTLSALYWAQLGGITTLVPTNVNLTAHRAVLPWTAHSEYARLAAQMPVAAAPATAFWTIQAIFEAKAGG